MYGVARMGVSLQNEAMVPSEHIMEGQGRRHFEHLTEKQINDHTGQSSLWSPALETLDDAKQRLAVNGVRSENAVPKAAASIAASTAGRAGGSFTGGKHIPSSPPAKKQKTGPGTPERVGIDDVAPGDSVSQVGDGGRTQGQSEERYIAVLGPSAKNMGFRIRN